MKLFFSVFCLSGLALSFLIFPKNSFAQTSGCPYTIEAFTVESTSPTPNDRRVLFRIRLNQALPAPTPLYVFIDYQLLDGVGKSYNNVPPTEVIIATDGSGVNEYILGDIYNGTYPLTITQDQLGRNVCTHQDTRFTIAGRLDPPAPPAGGCRQEGEGCIPRQTDSEICDIANYYCGDSLSGLGFVVKRRNCEINSGCCKTPSDPSNPSGPGTFTCRSGQPSSQDNSCTCTLIKQEPLKHPALCPDNLSIKTAIGCAPFDNNTNLAAFFFIRSVSISGGLAFIALLMGAFQITTSKGDPQKLKTGRDLITAAIGGILFTIFGVFILRIIGVNILGVL